MERRLEWKACMKLLVSEVGASLDGGGGLQLDIITAVVCQSTDGHHHV